MPDHPFRALDRLIQQANQLTDSKPDSMQMLAEMIRLVGADGCDPYLIIGVLVEAVAHTLANQIPAERRDKTALALMKLLWDRLQASGRSDRSDVSL